MGEHANDAIERGCEDWQWSYSSSHPPKKEGDLCACGGELIVRINRTTQVRFLGCINFPKCKFSTNIK